ncbi:MAG TPA: asparagine synthase (glutamine-hydrolyzing) [Flavitalea sp.]|nr:asparagine synthase (glutamine-hydrolyzing) [Flavitalea sp.]
MCGFGGIINSEKLLNTNRLKKISGTVSFRGPDSCGLRIYDNDFHEAEEGNTAIFFNRLAIIDLDKRSDQPFEDDRFVLVFNGEIYNYLEFKEELRAKNVIFRTTSDTEVLFHALREWGIELLPRLNGMFSFFWLDKIERKFIVARDRLGIKPLYYRHINDTFIYASELDSVIKLSDQKYAVSKKSAEMFLWMQYVPTPFTIVEGINKLPPGYCILGNIDGMGVKLHCFWDAYQFVQKNTHQKKDLEIILKNSLERQLHADVPLGLFLSSGVDSSLLAALVHKYFSLSNDVNFFTVQFEEQTSSDESKDAKEYIEGFNNPHLHTNNIRINPSFIQHQLAELYNFYDEPFGDPTAVLNWAISKKAKEYVTVAISGDGADELFWGYDRYRRWQKFTTISNTPLASGLAREVTKILPVSPFSNNLRFLLEKDPVKRHFNFFLPSGLRFNITDHIVNNRMWALQGVEAITTRNDLPAILDIKTYLSDAMLYKVDRSSMASSLEVRVPYLDNEVLEYALSLPLSEKSTERFSSKAPLKNLLHILAPHYDTGRPKKGFNFPLNKWLKQYWKDLVMSAVTSDNLLTAGLDPAPYQKIINNFYSAKNNYFTDVWFIFNLCLWIQKMKSTDRMKL